MFLTVRHVACRIFDHFRTSDVGGQSWISQLFCKLSSGNGSVQSFDPKWDGTIVAVRQQPDEEDLDDSHLMQLRKADQLKHISVVRIRHGSTTKELFQGKENGDALLGTEIREKHFSCRDRLNDKATPVVAAARGKGE